MNDLPYHASITPFNAIAFYATSRFEASPCAVCEKALGENAFDVSIPFQKIGDIWTGGLGAECCSEAHAGEWIEEKAPDWIGGRGYVARTEGVPSEYIETAWLYAFPNNKDYIEETQRSGKWLVFLSAQTIDSYWRSIAKAMSEGKLGTYAKALTAKDKRAQRGEKPFVICVYTYDYDDKADAMRVRQGLRDLNVKRQITYKADDDTRRLLYGSSYAPIYRA